MTDYLNTGEEGECSACTNSTIYRSKCCGQSVCDTCFLKWLETKRECMYCRADQIDFDTWINNFKKDDPEDTPSGPWPGEIMENMISMMNDIGQGTEVNMNTDGVFSRSIETAWGPMQMMMQMIDPVELGIWNAIKTSRSNTSW